MKKSFEEYLQQKFIDQFTGTKDQAEIAEENWFERLDVSELIEYGDDFAKSSVENALETVIDLVDCPYEKGKLKEHLAIVT